MAEVSLQIPQIGEGLQEARVVAFLKQPGDKVNKDDVIYQMETDKAVMDVESPVEGVLVKWLADVDDVLAIGKDVVVVETTDSVQVDQASEESSTGDASGQVKSLSIPAIGEGLQEARLVAKLKEAGEAISKDEIIYQMETDKAVMDVESPHDGVLVEWLAEVDAVLPIGAEVLKVQVEGEVGGQPIAKQQTTDPVLTTDSGSTQAKSTVSSGGKRRNIPPRTRSYAKSKGVSAEDLETISASGSKLMPKDIDAWLAGGENSSSSSESKVGTSSSGKSYTEETMASRQRVLASRLVRGTQLVVPGMMSVACPWGELEALRAEIKASGDEFQPSTFTLFAYAVAKAGGKHPIMRSTMVGDDAIRTYENLQLGIAVSRPGDELVVAVVEDADKLSWREFGEQAREKIHLARDGRDQANESVTLSITNMQGYGIRDAMAVVVPPGVATVFLGEAHNGVSNDGGEPRFERMANVGITIDHRLINGVGGAEFLNSIKENIIHIRDLVN